MGQRRLAPEFRNWSAKSARRKRGAALGVGQISKWLTTKGSLPPRILLGIKPRTHYEQHALSRNLTGQRHGRPNRTTRHRLGRRMPPRAATPSCLQFAGNFLVADFEAKESVRWYRVDRRCQIRPRVATQVNQWNPPHTQLRSRHSAVSRPRECE